MKKLAVLVLTLGLIFSTTFMVSGDGVGYSWNDEEAQHRLNYDPLLFEVALSDGEVSLLSVGGKKSTILPWFYTGGYVSFEDDNGFQLIDNSFLKSTTIMVGVEGEVGWATAQAEIGVSPVKPFEIGKWEWTPKVALLVDFIVLLRVASNPSSG